MKPFFKRCLKLKEINERAHNDAAAFIEEESHRYAHEIKMLAQHLATEFGGHCLCMLSGPSSAGKTTTAKLLTLNLAKLGVEAHTISMDDFYRGREQAPLLSNGHYDYEALEALNLDELERCMRELIKDGRTLLPQFDFIKGRPTDDMRELKISQNAVVIFEGIHAINPYFEQHLPMQNLFKIFVNTVSPIINESKKLLARREIRLTRRMLRDERFRNSSVINTLNMWRQVVRGENEYMFPFVDTVDYLIDTTHAYEPCIFAPLLLPLLHSLPDGHEYADTTNRLIDALSRFEHLPLDMMPKDALLREFVGE
ncbi:MAG: nucleoside kinase [Oscillospiraceae bacterium]|jgi:uridine kinase|nr:nucleoside kinase [Oscillospiraceae bacterium]